MPGWEQLFYLLTFGPAEIGVTWAGRIYNFITSKSDEDRLLSELQQATDYEDWWQAAITYDDLPEQYQWRVNPIDRTYDYRHLEERRKELNRLRRSDNVIAVASYLRHGLLRNMFNVTQPALYERTYTSTKDSIQAYVEDSVDAIQYIADAATSTTSGSGRLTAQEKLDVLHDSRSSFGSTALLLQGGSIFGLCHLGVVKSLLEHDVLPRVIVGTATGALMAALVGIHNVTELRDYINGDNIDLSAFNNAAERVQARRQEDLGFYEKPPPMSQLNYLLHVFELRTRRMIEKGFVLDPEVLQECVRANVGDLTFDEAYKRTDRILNIIISSPSEEVPSLLNYLSAPHILIRSAVMASHVANMSRHPSFQLLVKDSDGYIHALDIAHLNPNDANARRPPSAADRRNPLNRLKQQFNVDHFIISQARPYLAPFIQPSLPYVRKEVPGLVALPLKVLRKSFLNPIALIKQSIFVADLIGWLPDGLRRVISDETVKSDALTLVPEVFVSDWARLLKNPTKAEIDFWIMRGERSVWPNLCAIKVRCMIEMALDAAYERVRHRRSPYDVLPNDSGDASGNQSSGKKLLLPPSPPVVDFRRGIAPAANARSQSEVIVDDDDGESDGEHDDRGAKPDDAQRSSPDPSTSRPRRRKHPRLFLDRTTSFPAQLESTAMQ